MADRIVRGAEVATTTLSAAAPSAIYRQCAKCSASGGSCAECEHSKDEGAVQLKAKNIAGGNDRSGGAARQAVTALSGSGQPLTARTRAYFEPRFSQSFGDVRVHTNSGATTAADALNARAYAHGSDIAFANRAYRPETTAGQHLLAHELAHVVQQRQGRVPKSSTSEILTAPHLEREADNAAKNVLLPPHTGHAPPISAAGQGIQLKKVESPILYVGVTENAAPETKSIRTLNNDRGGVTTVTTTDPQGAIVEGSDTFDLTDETQIEAWAKTLSLPAATEQKVVDLLKDQRSSGRDELAQIVRLYAKTQADPSVPQMKRVVLSGHSGGSSIFGIGGTLSFGKFVTLAEIFPLAAAQVEHLHVSACSSGGHFSIEEYYLKAFPMVKTIWAYAGSCPTDSGAIKAQRRWERLTEKPGVKKLSQREAVWNDGTHRDESPEKVEDAIRGIDAQNPMYQEYFMGRLADSSAHSGPLTDYYRRLVRIANRGGVPEADRKRLQERQEQAMRLRYYAKVRAHFMLHHGKLIADGYAAAKLKMPDYETLSRAGALAAMDTLDAVKSKPDKAIKALELIKKGLKELDPNIVPEGWILDL
ncbi:MAG: DUF4157 domain-containing protein [Sulfitobacter sp.]